MKIRNFSIIAHIDHGKSTLSDRLLEMTHTIPERMMREQLLDKMDLERERGITIKAKAVRMHYFTKDKNGKKEEYQLNLIDTPGHVDFSYEVARSLRACEGVLLVVDASQGVEAQTIAHAHLAQSLGLKVIPVLNKIDLQQADPDMAEEQVWEILKDPSIAERVSAKTGKGFEGILNRIVKEIPAPSGSEKNPLSCLIFDSRYDPYRGVIIYLRVMEGKITPGMQIKLFSLDTVHKVEEVGCMAPEHVKTKYLSAGEVGYVIAGIKDIHDVKIGDTVIDFERPIKKALPGYQEIKPVVFASIFPVSPADYPNLRTAIEKLNLSDSAFTHQAESSKALGFGFRLGFMGLLHMEVVKERLEREFDLSLIVTSPNVVYKVQTKGDSQMQTVDNPARFPHYGDVLQTQEPYVRITIVTMVSFMESVMNLLKEKRGEYINQEHLSSQRVLIEYEMPLAEMVLDFYDRLKSASKGYASFDYELTDYKISDVVLMEILIHSEAVDALSVVVHKSKAQTQGRKLCEKLKELIPRQQFEIAIQARIKGKIIARENIRAMRKDVTAKCYGGDITRKRKLLEKQKEGKKRQKMVGNVEVPQEAFVAMLKIDK
jgi:GTP-binding protein LepA